MKELEYIKKIEQLNLEIIKLKTSKEFLIGNKMVKTKRYLKKLKFISFIKKIRESKKIAKFNAHEEQENNFFVNVENNHKSKIAVYTCITGNYDKEILEPFLKMENIDFYLFTDNENITSKYWKVMKLPDNVNQYNNILKNRYLKMHPKELFKDYDYSIYIDGNVKVMSDLTDLIYSINDKTGISMHRHQFRNCIYKEIEVCKIKKKGNYSEMKRQVDKYKQEGFPQEFGMLEATIIVSDLNNDNSEKILDDWWNEFISTKSLRDQISLHYVIWKNHLTIEDFGNLGYNLYRNPKFIINIH